jgi:hypothetical protein
MATGAPLSIIRAMDRHQDDAQVQREACGALCNLALFNDANQLTLMGVSARAHHLRVSPHSNTPPTLLPAALRLRGAACTP